MKVEVFCLGRSMGVVSFDNWRAFENYLLRWLTLPIQAHIKFEQLQDQIMWYAEVMELLLCVQLTQKGMPIKCWQVTIYPFDQVVNTFELDIA